LKIPARASDQDDPLKIAIDSAGEAADDESKATKSKFADHADGWMEKVKAIPGYERI
jgi:hypothetical protein